MRALLIFALAAGCTNLLDADFETDPVGQPPLLNPPSAADDQVQAQDGAGSVLVQGFSPIVGQRSLVLEGPSGDQPPRATFLSEALPHGSRPFHVFWQMNDNGVIDVTADISLNQTPLLTLNFEDGIVFANGESIGTYGFGPYGVQVGFFPELGNFSVSLTGDAEAETSPLNRPLPSLHSVSGQVILRLELTEADPSFDRLTVDEVAITQRIP